MYSMGHRYTESDFHTGLTRVEAKAKGLTRKRAGTLRMYFDGKVLVEAYSYNTCIMARMAPCEDFPHERMILNETNYGPTSNKHMSTVMSHAYRYLRFNERVETITFEDGTMHTYNRYNYERCESVDYTHRAILIDVDMGSDAADLVRAVTWMQLRASNERQTMRQRRIDRIERIREYNRSVEDYNATHNHANVILFPGSTK